LGLAWFKDFSHLGQYAHIETSPMADNASQSMPKSLAQGDSIRPEYSNLEDRPDIGT
jgi:hypothetical protein